MANVFVQQNQDLVLLSFPTAVVQKRNQLVIDNRTYLLVKQTRVSQCVEISVIYSLVIDLISKESFSGNGFILTLSHI